MEKDKKLKSKKFRVALSGKTVDGREISPLQIQEIAQTYDPKKYGARIWNEHLRGILPDSVFKALGDVLSVEAKEEDDGKWGLYAEISPTNDLVEINKNRQKVYSSIEIITDPDTQKPYLGGLAVTDSPASLGTEMLQFSAQKKPESLFSVYLEGEPLEFEDTSKQETGGLFSKVKALLSKHKKETGEQFGSAMADVHLAVEAIAEKLGELEAKFSKLGDLDKLDSTFTQQGGIAALNDLHTELAGIKEKLSAIPSSPTRPMNTGGSGTVQTDC